MPELELLSVVALTDDLSEMNLRRRSSWQRC